MSVAQVLMTKIISILSKNASVCPTWAQIKDPLVVTRNNVITEFSTVTCYITDLQKKALWLL